LKLDHQLNQLVLAQALQISAIHAHMDSEIGLPGKGARTSGASSRSARRKWRWVITAAFANRISYVISPEGRILYAYSDSNAEKHIENTLAVVRKWREEHKR
jgi:hypothetical protein